MEQSVKNKINLAKQLLLIAGVIELAVGLLHFAMPSFAYQTEGFSRLLPSEINFVTLVIFSVGILLAALGSLTIFFSFKLESMTEILFYYVVVKVILWSGRVTLELIYPVELDMFYIDPFTRVVLPGLVIELLLFVTVAFLIRKIINNAGFSR